MYNMQKEGFEVKTFLICTSKSIHKYAGQEYDDYLEVDSQPSAETIDELANRIADRIRKLWNEDGDDEERIVSIWLDAASPYNVVLKNFQIFMKEQENIEIQLPYLDDKVVLTDELKKVLGEDYKSDSIKENEDHG